MNTTTQAASTEQHLTGFPLRFGISIGAVSLAVIIMAASYICYHKRRSTAPLDDQDSVEDMELGVIDGSEFPRLLFSQAKLGKGDSIVGTCCAICLGEYKDEDSLWQLPDCCHMFHVDCVGPWLRLHGTCPVCRSSLHTVTPVQRSLFIPFAR